MPRITIQDVPAKHGSDYPPPYDAPLAGRVARNVAAAGGLTDFIANHVVIPPGGWSSQRHWHAGEDELVVIVSGSAVLIDDEGRHQMAAGDAATLARNDGNGHHLVNEGDTPCVLIAVSLREASLVTYSDIDLLWSPETGETHRDGTPY